MVFPIQFFLAGAMVLLASAGAKAGIIAEDSFEDYPVGGPPEASSGRGWYGHWIIREGVDATIETVDDSDGNATRCLKVSGASSVSAIARHIRNPEQFIGSPIFLRVDFDILPSSESAPVFGAWAFGDTEGYRKDLPQVTTTLQGFPSARIGTNSQPASIRLTPGKPRTLIAALDGWDASAQCYGVVSLWVDPKPDSTSHSQPLATATFTGATGYGHFNKLYFRSHKLGSGAYRFFNVRLATTWEEVIK